MKLLKCILLLLLMLFAYLVFAVLLIVNIPFVLLLVFKTPPKFRFQAFSAWVLNSMFGLDQTGNATLYPLLNSLRKGGLAAGTGASGSFGDPDETISHASGWVRYLNLYRAPGRAFAYIHNWVYRLFGWSDDHLEDARNNPQ